MFKKTATLLAAALAAPLLTSSAFAVDAFTDNFDLTLREGETGVAIDEGRDLYVNQSNDGWLSWATQGSTMARLWNPSTTDKWTRNNNEFYDTSWGGLDASSNANGGVIAIRTMQWDYRPNSSTLGFVDPDGNRLWNVSDSGVSDGTTRYEWRADMGGTPDHVRDAVAPTDPFTYSQETTGSGATDGSSWQGTATRDFEAVSQIVEAFDSTAKYTLSVNVGRLATNGYNTGSTILPGTDGVHGTIDDVVGSSTRYVNEADSYWGGYMADLIVGGDADTTGSSNGAFFYGQTTDALAAGYMETLASDDNTEAIAVDAWGTSTIGYTPGVGGDFSAMDGENLVIRLAAKELAGQHELTTAAAFDNVVLTKIFAGDANEDNLVNGTDLALLASNFGVGVGMDWNTGDFNGDGTVNGTDLALLAGNFGFDGTAPLEAPVGISIEEAYALAAVPEPTSLALLGLGGLMLVRRRRSL